MRTLQKTVKAFALSGLVLALSACATGQTLVKPDPTLTEQQQVRQLAARAGDGFSTGLDVVQELDKTVDKLSLDVKTKDDISCSIYKVLGSDAPSPTAVKACGALPARDKAPFHMTIETLRNVAACASLRSTVAEGLKWIDPLIAKLAASTNTTVSFAATALGAAFKFSRSLLGGSGCQA